MRDLPSGRLGPVERVANPAVADIVQEGAVWRCSYLLAQRLNLKVRSNVGTSLSAALAYPRSSGGDLGRDDARRASFYRDRKRQPRRREPPERGRSHGPDLVGSSVGLHRNIGLPAGGSHRYSLHHPDSADHRLQPDGRVLRYEHRDRLDDLPAHQLLRKPGVPALRNHVRRPGLRLLSGTELLDVGEKPRIAVVVLDQAVTDVNPAVLATAGLLDQMAAAGALATAPVTDVGYGWTNVVDKSSANWTGAFDGQRRYAAGGFQALTTSDLKVSENPALGYGGACSHDSRGPAFVIVNHSSVVAAELSSLQGNQCDSTYDSYRLDTASARAFLATHTPRRQPSRTSAAP